MRHILTYTTLDETDEHSGVYDSYLQAAEAVLETAVDYGYVHYELDSSDGKTHGLLIDKRGVNPHTRYTLAADVGTDK